MRRGLSEAGPDSTGHHGLRLSGECIGEPRGALAVRMVIGNDGRKRSHSFHRILMRSAAKLNYAQAQAASAGERAVQRGEWTQAGTASLAFHQSLADLTDSQRLSAFFGTIVAQLRLAFAEMEDEAAFQASWIPRDREIADHVLSGRRDTAAAELQRYLDDSEAMVLDVVRSARCRSIASDRGKAS